jgi:lauroyl/myristoyl acyltransferase
MEALMSGALSEDRNTATRGGAVLIRRAMPPAKRPLILWKDPAILGWLVCCALLAPLPRLFRWKVSVFVARFAARTHRARQARARIARILERSDQDSAHVVRQLYAGRLAAYIDVVRGLISEPDFQISFHGLAHVKAAQSQGRGTIFWISDFLGAGDVSKVALASQGFCVAHLSRPEHGFTTSRFGMRFLNPLRIKFECTHLAERVVFDRANPRVAKSRLHQILRHNGIVSIMASTHEGRTLADVPFLSGRLKLATGALRLAQLAGAPVLPVFVLRDRVANGGFDVIIAAPLISSKSSGEEGLLAAVGEYAAALETFVRDRPECWVGWRRNDQLSPEHV